jgi:hypothetical protein
MVLGFVVSVHNVTKHAAIYGQAKAYQVGTGNEENNRH